VTAIVSDLAVDLAATFTRRLWRLRGVSRASRAANGFLLGAGAAPMRIAKLREGTRFRVDLKAKTEWHAFYSGRFDDFWVKTGARLLGAGESYLDVGANVGFFSIRVARLRKAPGPVIAFEPVPGNIQRLRENIALNRVEDQVTLMPLGLSDADAEVCLSLDGSTGGSGTGNAAITDGGDIVARVQKLDDHPELIGDAPVGVIKVDIEGHEIHFFRGARATLGRDRPFIIAEVCRDFLRDAGLTAAQVYVDALPAGYVLFGEVDGKLVRSSFDALRRLENVLLCPEEKQELLEQRLK